MSEPEAEYITITADEIDEEAQARLERAALTPESVANNLRTMILSYMDNFSDDEQYHLSLCLVALGFSWFEEKGYNKELKNICLGFIENYCITTEENLSVH